MRLETNRYDTDEKWSIKTTTNGSKILETFRGENKLDLRTEVYVDVACWDTRASMLKLLEEIEWITERLKVEIKNNEAASAQAATAI